MKQTNTFTDNDTYIVMADEGTWKELYPLLGPKQPVKWIQLPKPNELMEGMLWRYQLHTFLDLTDKECMYLDVDHLSRRTFSLNLPDDTICVLPEGDETNSLYCGPFTLSLPCGVTSGFFAYKFGPNVKHILDQVVHLARQPNESFYSVDQPYFNKAVESGQYIFFEQDVVSYNGEYDLDTCYFISYPGNPGDGRCHWEKALAYYLNYCP